MRFAAPIRPAAWIVVLVVGGLLCPQPGDAQTILNIERLQPGDVDGFHWGVEGELSLKRGNTDSEEVLAGVAIGNRWSSDWLRVFVGVDYVSESDTPHELDAYVHTRLNHWFADRWQTFHFLQWQGSRDARLRTRALIGSGVRHRLAGGRTTFDIGSGVMFEREELDEGQVTDDHPLTSNLWRMANLAVVTRQLSEQLRLVGVMYLQPDLSDFEDVRTLTDLALQISLTEEVDLTLRGEWRHDSRPPGGVESGDFVFRTGFTVSFR